MERGRSFVPGHITGFFEVNADFSDPLRKGSRNCGPCIDAGVLTEVEFEEASDTELKIFINGERRTARTSEAAVRGFLKRFGITGVFKVRHSVQAPVGAGYGMSGSGALGSVLALSDALNLNLEKEKALIESHKAEIKSQSGLGDVGPEMVGGLVLGLEPGAPPYGKWEKISVPEDLGVICGTFGSLSTSNLLSDSDFKSEIKRLGKGALDEFLKEKSIYNLMKVSKKFSLNLNIFKRDFEEVMENISSNSPFGASAVLLGKAIFAPCPRSKIKDLKEVFLDYFKPKDVMITSIDFRGARTLK
ncbi:hypothetical protein AKJ51_01930 [candidate division MSBL1 archaeon SCGC-AAA382A20]|uniref:Pantoate kinase n=1 Tax=candidate division MSBL1 archaeon SCGC-AAA382A20 TaxID=1698280 RepID=A0A133VL12_9EURY|nr:hypothetical protein AKJ51_01930 [candidate division MSBL1 archaeon SCGC-AAA382A20]